MATAGPRDTTRAIVETTVYSTTTPTQLSRVVCNPDGSSVLGVALDSTNDSVGAVARASATIGGSDTYFNNALTNTVIAVKASAGNIYGYRGYNSGASYAFIQVFDVASASVTLGTTTPKDVYQIPNAGMYDEMFTVPVTHGTAVSIAATSSATGSGAPAATQSFTLYYK